MRRTALLPAAFSGLIAAASPGAAGAATWNFIGIAVPGSIPGSTSVSGINNVGEVVGTYDTVGNVSHGFVYRDGRYATFDVPGSAGTSLVGINDRGQIVGTYDDDSGTELSFLYSFGRFTNFKMPGAVASVNAFDPIGINDRGQVLGLDVESETDNTYYIYQRGAFKQILQVVKCRSPECTYTTLSGLNNFGQFVGTEFTYVASHAIVYDKSGMTTRPFPGAYDWFGAGINDRSQFVGTYYTDTGAVLGYLYTGAGPVTIADPNASGQTWLMGVNDLDQIIGQTIDANGQAHAFLATPDPGAPEPATWMMLVMGFTGLVAASIRRKIVAVAA